MSKFLDRFRYFKQKGETFADGHGQLLNTNSDWEDGYRLRYFKQKGETFADGHGQLLNTNSDWEDGYRQRWQHDKIVRSNHGVNCTGSCSWKIYVKNCLVTWETQQTD